MTCSLCCYPAHTLNIATALSNCFLNRPPSNTFAFMMLAGSKHWALFQAISPLFTSDIPWSSAGRSDAETTAVQEAGALLRAHISEIPFHVPQDAAFSDHTLSDFTTALESLLLALEALVQPSVLDDAAALGESQADLVEKYPKLSALSLFIRNDNFSIVHNHRFLYLNQRAVLLKATRSFAEGSLEDVRKLFRGSTSLAKDGFVAGNHLPPSSQPQYSQIFRDCSDTLFNTLEKNLRPCTSMSSKHKAFFHLKASPSPATGGSSTEMDLLLALCPKGNPWQEIRFTVPNHTGSIPAAMAESHERLIEDVCQVAREAYECQQAVSIYVHGNKLHDTSDFDEEPSNPEAEHTISLSSLLDDQVLRDRFKFPLVHKRILALTLARSLLNLYEGPWIQTDWSAEHVLFAYGTDRKRVYDIHQPYLPCTLSSEHEYQSTVSDPLHNNPLILSFGRLLMEMDKGERIAITKTVRSKPSLYRTLVAELDDWGKELLTSYYTQAVEGCLKFPKWLQANRGMSRELAYRKAILEKILHPLELEVSTFPNQGAGSRDIDLIRSHISPPEFASPLVRTSSIRSSTVVGYTAVSARTDASTTALGRVSRSKAMVSSRIGLEQSQTSHSTASSTLTISASRCPPTSLRTHSSSTTNASLTMRSSPVSRPYPASRVSPETTRRFEQSARPPTQSGRFTSISRCTQISSRPENTRDMPSCIRTCTFMFSESEMELSEDKKTRAKEFLKRFENFRLCNIHRCSKTARARIVVLDTGLDDGDIRIRALKRGIRDGCRKRENISYRDPVREKRNFVAGSPEHDEDGHGTHVIGLLLTLAPEADLYVGKISRGKKCENQDQGMAAALRWAVDEVKADIISMSFGFEDDSGWHDDMDEAIKHSFTAGRIAFAAASNYGGNSCRTYPAKAGTVFCIHASDGHGNPSGLDPTPIRGDYNFSTLGVAVPCGYTGDREIFKTGTSYATPVAAGLAANIIDLADWLAAAGELTSAQKKKLRSYEGMRNIFKLMAPSRRQDYDYVAPWNLWNGKVEEKIIWGKIREKLS